MDKPKFFYLVKNSSGRALHIWATSNNQAKRVFCKEFGISPSDYWCGLSDLTARKLKPEEVMETLGGYPVGIWGNVLAAVTSTIFAAKIDAAEIEREEAAKRAILPAPEPLINLTEENPFLLPQPFPYQWIDGDMNVIPFGDHSETAED